MVVKSDGNISVILGDLIPVSTRKSLYVTLKALLLAPRSRQITPQPGRKVTDISRCAN